MIRLTTGCFIVTACFICCPPANAQDVDFETQIAPIFQARCIECHGSQQREGGLRLTNRRDALAESDSGLAAIVPGKPDQSELLHRISSHDESEQMPPDGQRLTADEIALIKNWVAQGASWSGLKSEKHWAYVAPQRPELPEITRMDWPRNAVDYFVLNRLEREQLSPSSIEEPARLLRRVSMALTGLPPTMEQVNEFVADPSEENYEAFVDACLASSAYGERWAQPWLDLARYADSNGYQADQLRDSWAYRDWVIDALNRDQPFDQFVIEQLAGDLIPDATPEQRIATGFHRTVTCNVEAGVHPEENRVNQIFDRVNTTGTVFLGTTIECAQCHNHKYDPFTQDEYYELFAFFNNTPLEVELNAGVQYNFYGPTMDLPLPENDQVRLEELQKKLATLNRKLKQVDRKNRSSREAYREQLVDSIEHPPRWQVLDVTAFESTGGESFEVLDDNSILVGGSIPSTTIYTVTSKTAIPRLTAIRLEALTHPSLPGTGPGRGDELRANFILSEFQAEWFTEDNDSNGHPIEFAGVSADFSQQKWEVEKSIDGDRKTGWAVSPEFFQPHHAIFRLKSPLELPSDQSAHLRFTLDQNYGRGRTLGRIRLSGTDSAVIPANLPNDIRQLLVKKSLNRKEQARLNEFLDAANPEKIQLTQQIASTRKQIDALKPPTTLVMVEMEDGRETFKLKRGDYLNPGKPVSPDVPGILHSMDPNLPRNRLGLARWLVDPANPLLARVTVNRWWGEFFGHGLVASSEDFGIQADPPTHPQLLDWLAVELIASDWSTKHIHKQIVMSSTFRQSSRLNADLLERDPSNKLYARGPGFRMPAEMIRDYGLAVSGLLSRKMGGPPVMPFQPDNIWRAVGRNAPKWIEAKDEDRFRRGVYVVWRRAAPYPSFVNFDAPDRASCVVNRPRTNTPLQALTLLNDRAYVEMAVALADSVIQQRPSADARGLVELAIERALLRQPETDEIEIMLDFYQREMTRFQSDAAAARLLLKTSPTTLKTEGRVAERAALSLVCNVLLNVDEVVNY